MKFKTQPAPKPTDAPELALSCFPPNILAVVRTDPAALRTKPLNVFYILADSLEKGIRTLKEKCRPIIIARRNEGSPTGVEKQHREFIYQIPSGEASLIVQERMVQQPDPEKLEALLKSKNLWESALTTTLDIGKIEAFCKAGLITQEELLAASDAPRATYSLIAKLNTPAQEQPFDAASNSKAGARRGGR